MLKGLKHALACTLFVTSLFIAPAHANTQSKEIRWVGCGISRVGFMQDLADAYQKKTGIKVVIDGGGATRGIRDVAKHAAELGGSCRLPLSTRVAMGAGMWRVRRGR